MLLCAVFLLLEIVCLVCSWFNDLPQRFLRSAALNKFFSFYYVQNVASYAHVHHKKLDNNKVLLCTLTKIAFRAASTETLFSFFLIMVSIFHFFSAHILRSGHFCSAVCCCFFSIMLKWSMANIASVHYELQLRRNCCSLNAWTAIPLNAMEGKLLLHKH